jgi:hypothetical protein
MEGVLVRRRWMPRSRGGQQSGLGRPGSPVASAVGGLGRRRDTAGSVAPSGTGKNTPRPRTRSPPAWAGWREPPGPLRVPSNGWRAAAARGTGARLLKTEHVGCRHRLRHAFGSVVPPQGGGETGRVIRVSTSSLTRTSKHSGDERGVVRTEPPQRRAGPQRFSRRLHGARNGARCHTSRWPWASALNRRSPQVPRQDGSIARHASVCPGESRVRAMHAHWVPAM